MKMADYMALQNMFSRPDKPLKIKKEKSKFTFKDYVKFQEELKRYEEMQKLFKKEEKKEDKKGWEKMSVIQRTCILTLVGPPLVLGYIMVILTGMKMIAKTIGVQ